MTPAYNHIMSVSPVLRHRDRDPANLVHDLRTASSGESVMIRAALSLIPAGWLREDGVEPQSFRLNDVGSLDAENTRALLEAVAIQTGHTEVLYGRS